MILGPEPWESRSPPEQWRFLVLKIGFSRHLAFNFSYDMLEKMSHAKKGGSLKKICINTIRRLPGIEAIIKKCAGFGRSWGKKGSLLHGSHIIFINPEEIVLVRQGKIKDSSIILSHFKKTDGTVLGAEVKRELMNQGIEFLED